MPRTSAGGRLWGFVLGAALTAALAACKEPAAQFVPPPVSVGVLEVRPRDLPLVLEYPAQLRGVREVEVRARVSGILLKRHYREGSRVEAGDLLFSIDPEPFRAEAARARAQLGVQKVNLDQARRERDRVLPLFERKLASAAERDAAVAAYESAEAAVRVAEAALQTAELNLSYTEVRAPIGGLTSREVRSEGSLVNAADDSALLTHIVQTDPLYVEFAIPGGDAELLREEEQAGSGAAPFVRVVDASGKPIGDEAKIEFVSPRIDDQTGTVDVRAVLSNPDGALLPGRIVRARIEGIAVHDALVVPKRALMHGAEGPFVWTVGEDGKAAPRPVQPGASSGNYVALASGVSPGERIVVDGILKVQPGGAVAASPVALEDAPAGDSPSGAAGGAPQGDGAAQGDGASSPSGRTASAPDTDP
ncbi:MAG TPA: efflux RND transporter periplasmic adaptor subunit [Gammaproteobacteria bacterium]|nr:efflux RND transporter periplasmic adaptor subunit [Gammaproteobacteria bacterium]